ncbi:acyltransferase family protein [Microbacterium sp. Root180]|uniref:acyltransferase family protein n=1 Tax=Microbacterium sp. Root180 TaxID=1736483 RepID=UPI0019111442|nr:acyltransferase [Microbacterium sp. Root180]
MFDPRRNALNFVRLTLAVTVIGWHSFPLTGHDIEYAPLRQLVGEIGVDGFFAISGFLIVASWVRDPNWARYLRARALRILPAFWVCLLVTAFVIAPLAAGVLGGENVTYVLYNAGLRIFQEDIAGTPLGVPYEGVWNGSLWTLWWEFLCYLGVMGLGLVGILRWRWTTTILFGVALAVGVATTAGVVDNWYAAQGSRFGLMFLAGAMVWQWKDRIPVNAWTLTVAGAVLIASLLTPNYRLLAALPVAYLVMVAGASIKTPRLALRNDVSYGVYIYAFPAQQVVAYSGVDEVALMAVAATLLTFPLAIASWFLVEKPAMRLKAKRPEPASPVAAF